MQNSHMFSCSDEKVAFRFAVKNSVAAITLRVETFAGRNFRVFRVFGPFSRRFMPLEISKQQNAKVFSREIIDNFKHAKVFSREKKPFFPSKFKAPP